MHIIKVLIEKVEENILESSSVSLTEGLSQSHTSQQLNLAAHRARSYIFIPFLSDEQVKKFQELEKYVVHSTSYSSVKNNNIMDCSDVITDPKKAKELSIDRVRQNNCVS
jgi:hypothetical protein